MKASSGVLWGVVGVLVAIAIAASCANGTEPSCDPVECNGRCMSAGHAGGHCDQGACLCTERPPVDGGADADAPDTRTDDADGRTDDGTRPDDARVDDSGGTEGTEGGEAKSACDPLLCFLSCGGTCSVGGECVCDSPAP